jgi:hypothetical protein
MCNQKSKNDFLMNGFFFNFFSDFLFSNSCARSKNLFLLFLCRFLGVTHLWVFCGSSKEKSAIDCYLFKKARFDVFFLEASCRSENTGKEIL